jgi:hypothetical protein
VKRGRFDGTIGEGINQAVLASGGRGGRGEREKGIVTSYQSLIRRTILVSNDIIFNVIDDQIIGTFSSCIFMV